MTASEKQPATNSAERHSPLVRLGNVSCADERTFWFLLHDETEAEGLDDLVAALRERYPRLGILFTAPRADLRDRLRRRFPGANVVPPPVALRLAARRYLVNLNVRAVLIMGAVAESDESVVRAANDRAVPVSVARLEGAKTGAAPWPRHDRRGRLDHHFAASEALRDQLLELGTDGDRITLLPEPGAARGTVFMEVAARLLAQDLKLKRSHQRPFRRLVEGLVLRLLSGGWTRRILAAKARRLDSLEQLRGELGDPETILCLGNGPSSEDPEVAQVAHDCLFRVNDIWLKRGLLDRPDMVFTGSKSTLALVKGAIFGLHTTRSEARLLVAPLLRPTSWGFRYATIERFGLFLSEGRWAGMRPTNGAIMLATAVALQPRRLVISGIDLFSHPAGSYPGDTTTPNAYSPGHSADSELEILLAALSLYRGELVIISEALREQWEARRHGPTTRQAPSQEPLEGGSGSRAATAK